MATYCIFQGFHETESLPNSDRIAGKSWLHSVCMFRETASEEVSVHTPAVKTWWQQQQGEELLPVGGFDRYRCHSNSWISHYAAVAQYKWPLPTEKSQSSGVCHVSTVMWCASVTQCLLPQPSRTHLLYACACVCEGDVNFLKFIVRSPSLGHKEIHELT